MRYSRLLIALLVVLALAAMPTPRAHAAETSELLERVETLATIADEAAEAAELARWGGLVTLLGRAVDLDRAGAVLLLGAFTDLVEMLASAGERAGVLTTPDLEDLRDTVFELLASSDPDADRASAKAAYLTQRAIDATERLGEAEQHLMRDLADRRSPRTTDPVERWRSLVERYFDRDKVGEAMSIIACESNGDPEVRNGRSGAAGLFQFVGGTWSYASERAGFTGASPLDPEANIAVAAWLVEYSLDRGAGAWSHWSCRPRTRH